jgi:hypothetical protein
MQLTERVVVKANILAAVSTGSNTLAWQAELSLVQQVSQLSPKSQTVFRLFGAVHAVRSGFETLPVGQLMLKRERGDVRMDNELRRHSKNYYLVHDVASGSDVNVPASHLNADRGRC